MPVAALARLDGGDVPERNHLGDQLVMPTPIEATLLGRAVPIQQFYFVKDYKRPKELRPTAVHCHGVTVANARPQVLRDCIPMRAAELPGNVTVLVVDVCRSREELEALVRRAKPVEVSVGDAVLLARSRSTLSKRVQDG